MIQQLDVDMLIAILDAKVDKPTALAIRVQTQLMLEMRDLLAAISAGQDEELTWLSSISSRVPGD